MTCEKVYLYWNLKPLVMKRASIVCLLLPGLLVCLSTMAQQPICSNPVGDWQDKVHNKLTVQTIDSATGELKGIYQPAGVSDAQAARLTGWLSVTPASAGGSDFTGIAFSASVDQKVVSWTGYCRTVSGVPTITALAQTVQPNSGAPDDPIVSTITVFVPSEVAVATDVPDSAAVLAAAATVNPSISACQMQGGDGQGNPPKARLISLNLLKNRNSAPHGAQINSTITLTSMMNSQDDPAIFNQRQGATITGVLFGVKQEKGESCNCESKDAKDWDFHIYIGDANAKSIFDCVVVEMTPFSRALHPEWTLDFVQHLKGKTVQVTGWLMYDFEHTGQSFESNPDTHQRNRHTVWELHPVTAVNVVSN
jgi:hypothetical protein